MGEMILTARDLAARTNLSERFFQGHASVVTTEKVYAFLKVENLHEAVGTRRQAEDLRPKLDAVLGGTRPQTSMKSVTWPDTTEIKTIDTIKQIPHYGSNHNP